MKLSIAVTTVIIVFLSTMQLYGSEVKPVDKDQGAVDNMDATGDGQECPWKFGPGQEYPGPS